MEQQNLDELYAANRGKDRYQAPDFYAIDELLTEEQQLIRASVRDWVKRDLSPIIEYYAQHYSGPCRCWWFWTAVARRIRLWRFGLHFLWHHHDGA